MSIEIHVDRAIGDERCADREVADLADQQHGVVAHRQLIAMGLGKDAIHHRVKEGRLHRVYRGVYAVGRRRISLHGRWMAAVLNCGPGSLLSHRCAAAHLGLLAYLGTQIHLTVINRRPRAAISVHRVSRLHDEDRDLIEGIPVTSIERTLLDIAGVVRPDQLDRALEASERLGLFNLRKMEALMRRSRGRRGLRALDVALRTYREEPMTRSELERRFFDVVRKAGLPTPATNIWIAGKEVDATWTDQRLVVELDSHEFHSTRAAFERDRIRDTELQLDGYRVLRITDRRLNSDPHGVAAILRSLLASRPRAVAS